MPLVFRIIRGSCVDGPGIRTVVFLKGCPLRCFWCHNPQSWSMQREIEYHSSLCDGCNACMNECKTRSITPGNEPVIDRSTCSACSRCVKRCDNLALKEIGREYSAEELAGIVLRDIHYYTTSGGGVTFSGGEPLLHIHYLHDVVKILKARGIHVAFETSGYFHFELFQKKLLPFTDLLLFDLKTINEKLHILWTGRSNRLILKNFIRLVTGGEVDLQVRVPLIPGSTASPGNLSDISRFVKQYGASVHSLLPYNPPSHECFTSRGSIRPPQAPYHPLGLREELALRRFL